MDDVQGAEVVQRAADLAHDEADLLLVQAAGVGQMVPVEIRRTSGCTKEVYQINFRFIIS